MPAAKPRSMYPIALEVRGRRALVVGGGPVAARKAAGLCEAGAEVVVVAPSLDPALRDAEARGHITALERAFEPADLDGAFLAFAATGVAAVDAAVVAAARARGVLVNDATGGPGDFANALAHRAGTVTFTVDTGGASPSFARRLQRELRERFDERYGRAAAALGFARAYVKSVVPPPDRARIMGALAERDIDELAAMTPSAVENDVDELFAAHARPPDATAAEPFAHLTCATRASALAMWQTRHVMALLAQAGVVSTVLQISTKGDRVLDRSLAAIGTDGLFVKELENALRDGRADYAVHSCKDLPSTLPEDMLLAAVGPRADPRDAFCSERYASLEALPAGALIGTSSPRRRAQLEALRPDLRFEVIRGNVDTRLRKLRDGEFDAILLAMAGLTRLGLGATHTLPLEPDVIVPAVGQGALAIEVRATDAALARRIAELFTDHDTERCVWAERAFLRTLEGGCQAPVGAYATIASDALHIEAAMAEEPGRPVVRGSLDGIAHTREDAERIGITLANDLLARTRAAEPLAGRLFLLPRTQERASQIAHALRGAGAEVVEAPDSDSARAQLGERTPHALLFPSSGSVHAIEAYLASLRGRPERPIVTAMGEASSAAAREAGFPPDVVAPEATVGSFVHTVTRYVMSKAMP